MDLSIYLLEWTGKDPAGATPARPDIRAVFADQPKRLAHVLGVVDRAEELKRWYPGEAGTLVTAAMVHDIGYATAVVRTGFHPLDGATWAAEAGYADAVVGSIFFHTGAPHEAEVYGGEVAEVYAAAPGPTPETAVLTAWVTYCDLCTAPDGSRVTPEARIAEILDRFPASHPAHRAVTASRPSLLETARGVESHLARLRASTSRSSRSP